MIIRKAIPVAGIFLSLLLLCYGIILFHDNIFGPPSSAIPKSTAHLDPQAINNSLEDFRYLLITDAEALDNKSFLEMLAAEFSGRDKLLSFSRTHAMESLGVAPENPILWLRLGFLDQLLNSNPEEKKAAIIMSIKTGPYLPNLLIPRLKFALQEWDNFSEIERNIIRSQIKVAWNLDRKQMEDIVKDERAGKIISETLGQAPMPLISPRAP